MRIWVVALSLFALGLFARGELAVAHTGGSEVAASPGGLDRLAQNMSKRKDKPKAVDEDDADDDDDDDSGDDGDNEGGEDND
jgi:hypothetical protein